MIDEKKYPARVAAVLRYLAAGNTIEVDGVELAMNEDGLIGHAVTVNDELMVNTIVCVSLNVFLKTIKDMPDADFIAIVYNNVARDNKRRRRFKCTTHPPVDYPPPIITKPF